MLAPMIAARSSVSLADEPAAVRLEAVRRRRFSASEYHAMIESGILQEDERTELIAGEIVRMSPIGSRHAACVNRLNRLLSRGLGEHSLVSVQNPISLGESNEPQPDVAVLRPRADDYAESHPGPEEVLWLIEVAETSVEVDRRVKIPLYGQAGIAEAWLVRLVERCIEVYRDPAATGYRTMQTFTSGAVSSLAFPELALVVEDLLG
jgi:Uma2 family endonuclease